MPPTHRSAILRAPAPHRRRVGRRLPPWCLAPLVLLLGACAGAGSEASLYVHPNADLALYRRVAVLPLANLTTDRFAGERVREVLNVELAALGMFEVVDSGEVLRTLRKNGVTEVAEIDPQHLTAIGQDLRAQALLMGTVLEFRERRSGSFTTPEIALSLRMLDVESGVVVWSVSDARSGIPLRTRLFGTGEKSQTTVVRELIRELLAIVLDWT